MKTYKDIINEGVLEKVNPNAKKAAEKIDRIISTLKGLKRALKSKDEPGPHKIGRLDDADLKEQLQIEAVSLKSHIDGLSRF
jgi:hypothetical protein